MRRTLSRLLVVLAASVAAAGVVTTPALADGCSSSPCVFLPGGSYTLGNPVSHTAGVARSTTTVLEHCDRYGQCHELLLSLPGVTVTSTETALLTLHVPDAGVELVGTTPTLHLGNPVLEPHGPGRLGLTLTVSGTPFVLWDTMVELGWMCAEGEVTPVFDNVSGHAGICSYSFTVSV